MSFAKNLGLKLALLVFGLGIFGLAVSFSINHVFGTPDNLKSSLQEGGVYEVLASEIADQLVSNATAHEQTSINDDALRDAAHTAVTPDLVKENSDKIIDGTYSWLDGSTPTPEFRIDTGAIQQQLTASLSQSALDRVKGLPACTPTQLQKLSLSNQDPFSLPCRPPSLSLNQLREQFDQKFRTQEGEGLAQGDVISSADFTNQAGQNVFTQAERVPAAFQLGQKLPWICAVLAIISAAIIVYFSVPRLKGFRSLSVKLLITGMLLFAAMFVLSFIFDQVGSRVTVSASQAGNAPLTVIRTLSSQVNNSLKIFAFVYVIVSFVGLILPRLILRRKQAILTPNPQTAGTEASTPPPIPTQTEISSDPEDTQSP